MRKWELRGEFHRAVLEIVVEELPGVRRDVHRKIANKIASRAMSELSHDAREAKKKSDALEKELRKTIRERDTETAKVQQHVDSIMQLLRSIRGNSHGEAR